MTLSNRNKLILSCLLLALTSALNGLYAMAFVQGAIPGLLGTAIWLTLIGAAIAILIRINNQSHAPLKYFSIVIAISTLYNLYGAYLGISFSSILERVISILLLLGVALVLFRSISDEYIVKSILSLSAFGLIFTTYPYFSSLLNSPLIIQKTLSVSALFPQKPRAVVILILDELSPLYGERIISRVNEFGYRAIGTTVQKGGENTVNAIPSMLSGRRHDEVTVCNRSTLCGSITTDFKNFSAENSNTDLVGFAFPYCDIANLRTCFVVTRDRVEASIFTAAWHDVVCGLAPFLKITPLCKSDSVDSYRYTGLLRQHIERLAFDMPFWRDGGILYIHTPLPHPPGEEHKSLENEYEENVSHSINLIKNLSKNLESHFGADFALVVTSDHPLRTAHWCKEGKYASTTCASFMASQQDAFVPFIVVSSSKVSINLPKSNLGVWAAVK